MLLEATAAARLEPQIPPFVRCRREEKARGSALCDTRVIASRGVIGEWSRDTSRDIRMLERERQSARGLGVMGWI